MSRVFNFSAGPAALPLQVLEQAQSGLTDAGPGMSVMEMSHRSDFFGAVIEAAESNLRSLLGLGNDFRVLFLQGGASLQFSMLAMNFLRGQNSPGQYIIAGSWGKKAIAEAEKEGRAVIAWDGKSSDYRRVPAVGELRLDPAAAYLHFTSNETIQGVQFSAEPDSAGLPLICDASSDILSRKIDAARYALIYAGAQKNLGPSGVTIVAIRDSMLERIPQGLPSMLDYRLMAEKKSLYNTPPTFAIYLVKLVTDWILALGGVAAIEKINRTKAKLLYQAIDVSDGFYRGHAEPSSRSGMNVTFRLANQDLEAPFLDQAAQKGLCELKGHRSVGGIRASIYNAMPKAGAEKLAEFMADFQRKQG